PEVVGLGVIAGPRWRRVVVGCVPVAVVGLVLYAIFFRIQNNSSLLWLSKDPLRPRVAEAGRQALMGPGGWDDRLWIGGLVLVVLGLALLGVRADARERAVGLIMAVMATTGVVLALAATVVGSDFFLGRNLIGSLVPFAIVVAVGFGARRT